MTTLQRCVNSNVLHLAVVVALLAVAVTLLELLLARDHPSSIDHNQLLHQVLKHLWSQIVHHNLDRRLFLSAHQMILLGIRVAKMGCLVNPKVMVPKIKIMKEIKAMIILKTRQMFSQLETNRTSLSYQIWSL